MSLCANCGCDLTFARERAVSSLYSPDRQFDLCVPCMDAEEALIVEVGTNDIPERVAAYRRLAEAGTRGEDRHG